MKNFFDYDNSNPTERQERFTNYPELTKFYIALSEELPREEYENLYESEKQSFYSLLQPTSIPKQNQWIR